MSRRPDHDRTLLDRERSDLPLWRQAATGIGVVAVAALVAITAGVLLSAVVAWLY